MSPKLTEIAPIAVACGAPVGYPPEVTIAQWAVESAWGEKPVGKFGCWGVKYYPGCPLSVTVLTTEVVRGETVHERLEFADYLSLAAACADYVRLITTEPQYAAAWQAYQQSKAVDSLIRGIARVYVGSDPGHQAQYAALVIEIAHQGNVQRAIAAAKSALTI